MSKIISESSDGPMRLVEVVMAKMIITDGTQTFTTRLHLKGGALFCCSNLHAFVVIRDGVEMLLRGGAIRKGDRFWLDVSAFNADGSIYFGKQNGGN